MCGYYCVERVQERSVSRELEESWVISERRHELGVKRGIAFMEAFTRREGAMGTHTAGIKTEGTRGPAFRTGEW